MIAFIFHPLFVLFLSIILFTVIFRFSARYSAQNIQVYKDFSIAEQGDWCSRINSTVHACLVVVGILWAFHIQNWDENFLPLASTDFVRVVFSFSCGYFIFDFYVILKWRVPQWQVFAVHHVVAATPYLIYNFHAGCEMNLYLLSSFLLVEIAVIPLNLTTFLEQLGHGKTKLHTILFFVTYVTWFLVRVLLPLQIIYMIWMYVVPQMLDAPFCVIPAAICAHIIAAFCIGVFFFIWTPDALAKWRQTIAKLEEYSDYPLTLRLSITPRNSPIHHSDRSTSVSNHQKEKSYGSCFSEEREEGGILKHDA